MNNNVKLEIEKEAERLFNQQDSLKNVQKKLEKIQSEVENLEKGIDRTLKRIELLGEKQPRVDQKPEPQEVVNSKKEFNDKLKAEKYDLLKNIFLQKRPDLWAGFEKVIPDVYRGI